MLAYRPAARPQFVLASRSMGALSSMTGVDWLLLLGGAVVGGAGINGLVGHLSTRKPNAIGVLLDVVLAGVGLALFVDKGSKAVS